MEKKQVSLARKAVSGIMKYIRTEHITMNLLRKDKVVFDLGSYVSYLSLHNKFQNLVA